MRSGPGAQSTPTRLARTRARTHGFDPNAGFVSCHAWVGFDEVAPAEPLTEVAETTRVVAAGTKPSANARPKIVAGASSRATRNRTSSYRACSTLV